LGQIGGERTLAQGGRFDHAGACLEKQRLYPRLLPSGLGAAGVLVGATGAWLLRDRLSPGG